MSLLLPSDVPGQLIAHRGASIDAPENTLEAYALAADAGFGWIEVDAQLTRDGHAVMIHDFTVDRSTNGKGFVCDHTLEQIQALDAAPHHPTYRAAIVPTLEDTIHLCLKRNLGLVLELKPIWGADLETARVVAEILNRLWPRDNLKLVVTSFSTSVLMVMRREAPWVPRGLATELVPADPTAWIDMLGVGTFHLNYQFALKRGLDGLLATGAQVAVATVNDPEIARRLLAMGAQGVMTDTIGLLNQDQAA